MGRRWKSKIVNNGCVRWDWSQLVKIYQTDSALFTQKKCFLEWLYRRYETRRMFYSVADGKFAASSWWHRLKDSHVETWYFPHFETNFIYHIECDMPLFFKCSYCISNSANDVIQLKWAYIGFPGRLRRSTDRSRRRQQRTDRRRVLWRWVRRPWGAGGVRSGHRWVQRLDAFWETDKCLLE